MKSAFHRAAQELLAAGTDLLVRHPKRISAVLASLMMGATGLSFAIANLAPDAAQLPVRSLIETLETPALALQAQVLDQHALNLYRSELSRSTDTAEILLKRLGINDPQAAAFLRSDTLVQKNLLGRAGRAVTAEANDSNALLLLQARWSPDDDGTFKRLRIEKSAKGYQSRLDTLPLSASTRMAGGTIRSSLFAATDDARIPDAIAIQLAEVFSGDIDFHRALRKGDRFSVVYETLEGDGEPMRAGRLLGAEFVNDGKTYQAMWFQDPASGPQGHGGYYTLGGDSLKRAFLAAPLAFSRVTSGFKMRFHPILQVWRAHLGVDYAAPTGTPVRSVGDGVVEFAGVQGGFGNVVKIRHAGQTSTVYAHLSRIQARAGQTVAQGQTVGLVGMTGWATGPHLHFEYRVNGVYQDPQTVARRNNTVPLTASLRPAFNKAAAQTRTALAAASQVQFTSVE